MTGLIVEQNYPKVIQAQYVNMKKHQDPVAEQELLERLHKAAESMSDYNIIENQIRGGESNWSLLPTAGMFTVKCGYHAGGETGGSLNSFPEFTAWMGKNSTMGKNYRLLNELSHHMNYRVSANAQELRQTYVPILRERILRLLKAADNVSIKEAISLMDDYGLNRDDIAEKLDVLVVGKKGDTFDDLDSKQKAAFTREYNAGIHMSQALVQEQGGGAPKARRGTAEKALADPDVIDEDGGDDVEEEDSDVDEEKELKKLQEQFKKKGRKKAAPKKAAPKKSKSKN